jgi:4'-phosphopantetheinyl transferase
MTCLNAQWNSPPVDYRIDRNTVHVWRAYFQPTLVSDREFLECISKIEIERAQRFIRQSDRDRYIFSHGLLRSLLGAYVDCAPQQFVFETKQHRKPFLISPDCSNDIRFNLSHSEDMVLIAVTRGAEVGIDVECVRRIPDALQIVNATFSVDEREFLNSLPPRDFEEGFFTCWTSKEAFLKGIGKGLSYPLDEFSINFPSGESECLVNVHGDLGNTYCWKVIKLSPGPGYSGALAIEELRSELQFFEHRWD